MPRRGLRRLLHPSDFSSASRAAFMKALELARSNRAELLLLHVRSLVAPMVGEAYVTPKFYDDLERASRAAVGKDLDRLVARAKRSGARAKALIGQGVAADVIVSTARRTRADMVVMGTHGRTGASRFFLGSVASRVVALARCPVLTVRGR